MSDALFPYYEQELLFIRQFAQEFAKKYPAAAGRLMLEANRSGDPHIERLIESFALVAGRIHRKLDDEFPELTNALLGVLYPHYLAPVPSMAVVQFELDPTQAQLPNGFLIDRNSRLQTQPVSGLRCRFRAAYPTTLWPLQCTAAKLQSPPFPPGLQPPPRTVAAVRIELECLGKLRFQDLTLDRLRLFLAGSNHIVANLYELIFNHTVQVVFRSDDSPDAREAAGRQVVCRPQDVLRPVGFEPDEGLLPYPPRSLLGYRLLTEFFTCPQKFLFVDLGGWREVSKANLGRKVEAVLFLNRTIRILEPEIEASTFRLGCTPVVNLFEQTAEPIPLTHVRHEYRVVPDVQHPFGKEVYSVESVVSTTPGSATTIEYEPFYAFRHGQGRESQQTFWSAARRPSTHENDRASEIYLSFVDRSFNPRVPAESTLVVRTLCTNRNLTTQLQHVGEELHFELEAAAPLSRLRCVVSPTSPLRPPLRRGAHWALISHLNLNHLSLSDPTDGCAALKQILRLYDFSDPDAGQRQLSEVTQQLIEGITGLSTRRVAGRTGLEASAGFTRGVEVTLEFDEQKYVGTGVYLFASVLERFLALYASINSFSQLVAKTKQREGAIKKWPPRTGAQQLI